MSDFFRICLIFLFFIKKCEWVIKFFPSTVRKYWIAAQILYIYTVYLPLACVYTAFSDLRVFILFILPS